MANQTSPLTPTTLSAMGAAALQIKAYNTKLRLESVINDVFESLSGAIDYSEKGATIPDAIFMKLEAAAKGANSIVVPLLMRLKGAPIYGTTELIGKEEKLALRHMTVRYNLIRKAVATENYGVNANDVSAYDLYGQVTPLMIDWFKELRGRRIREASLLRVAEELTEAPTSLKHRFNSNIFVPHTELGGMPVFDISAETETDGATYGDDGQFAKVGMTDGTGTYIDSICDVLKAATADWATPANANLTIEALLALDYYCVETLHIEPIMIDGKPTLIFAVPSTQMIKLLNPTTSAGDNIGAIWKNVSALSKIENMIPNAYCRVRHLLLVEDTRYATVTVSGDATTPSWVLTVGFLQPGNQDGRNKSPFDKSTNQVFDVGCVYGKGALVEWIVNPLKYATEAYDYEMVKGKGAYTCAGIQLAEFNVDTATSAKQYQNSSCIVLMTPPVLVTV